MKTKKYLLNVLIVTILSIALFSVYSCESLGSIISGDDITVDDVTGDVGDVVAVSGDIKALLRDDFTEEEKYYIGRSTCAYVFSKYSLIEDVELTKYLNEIGSTNALASKKATTFNGYRFLAFKDEHPNAYATPGGMILISTGMLKLCDNEDELAAVLAHEVEHIVKDHPMQAVSKANKDAALLNIAKYYAQKASKDVEIPEFIMKGMIDGFANILKDIVSALDNGYEKETEYEADAGAVETLATSGYSVDGLKSIILKLPHVETSNYGANHPTPAERVAAIDAKIAELKITPRPVSADRTARFNSIIK